MENNTTVKTCEIIFPELKESENEKMIKALKEGFKYHQLFNPTFGGIPCIEIVNWLEKQGEQKTTNVVPIPDGCQAYIKNRKVYIENYTKPIPADKAEPKFKADDQITDKQCANSASVSDGNISVTSKEVVSYPTTIKPKFKVGDFIVNDYCMGRVVELTNDAYLLDTEQGIPFSCEHNVHRWSIQDAKDGDIIYIKRHKNNSEWLLIFKEIKIQNNLIDVYDYYAYSITTNNTYHQGFCGLWGLLLDDEIVCPATKEQCNLLFAKMKEEGYEWDAEKKDLKKISQKYPLTPDECIKSAWSEEDENVLEAITYIVKDSGYSHFMGVLNETMVDWLKSLKERIK